MYFDVCPNKLSLKLILGAIEITTIGVSYIVGITCGTYIEKKSDPKYIPDITKVQRGYIPPSDISIKCEDLDGNGKLETIMKIDDKLYLLKEVSEKPVLEEYKK